MHYVESPESVFSAEEALAILREADPSSALFLRARDFFNDVVEVQPRIPRPTPRQERRFLTIGMATYDDFDGCYFTILAIRIFHPEIWDDLEILVVDNNPAGPCGSALKDFEHWVPHYRYIPYDSRQSTASRDLVFREAAGDFVLCVDSHVFFPAGALSRFVDYCRAHPDTNDLLQGPLIGDDFHPQAACFKPVWCVGMYGQWESDARADNVDSPPFEILMQGLGVFGCRREAWPGFNPRLAGFGGEEGYIHEKIRRAGGRNLCLPFLRWLHRFERPIGVRYTLTNDDRVRNYLLIYDELALDPAPVIDHFTDYLGKEPAQELFDSVQTELRSPFHFFDTIYCLNLDRRPGRWALVDERFRALSIHRAVRRFPAADTPVDPRIGHVLSHRRMIAQARVENLEHILLFDDNIGFSPDASRVLAAALDDLAGREWDLLFLGGCRLTDPDPNAPACAPLPATLTVVPVPDTHAMACRHTAYDAILEALPDNAAAAVLWLDRYPNLAEFYATGLSAARRFFTPSPIAVADSRR